MGVRLLQTFICKDVPNGFIPVNIIEEINQWKLEHNGTSPILIFDVMGILKIFSRNKCDVIFGGRHQIELEICEKFFAKLKTYGATLVFFCDGPLQSSKLNVWVTRQDEKYAQSLLFFDALSTTPVSEIGKNSQLQIPSITTIIGGFMQIVEKYGQIHVSVNNECDAELAQYALSNNALAIIANDTDFLIFEGNWKYWSAADINLDTLITMEYSRPALRSFLRLSSQQLALFATLGGNDYVKYDNLKNFHNRLGSYRYKFVNLAKFVRSFGQLPQYLSDNTLTFITKDCLGNIYPETVKLIKDSIKSYDLNFETNLPRDPLLQKAFNDSSIYSLLVGLSHSITLSFFDLRHPDFMSYIDIVLPLVRRRMGILLQHKGDPSLTRLVRTKISHDSSHVELNIYPDYPKMNVPDLLELTYNADNTSLNDIRWELLQWMISVYLKPSCNITHISDGYFVVVLSINYLLQLNQISILEADAILITVDDAKKRRIPNDFPYPKYADSRTVMIAHLYTNIHNQLLKCFRVVGLGKFMDYLVFDGLYFHNLVERFHTIGADVYTNCIKQIQQYRIYIT